MIIFARDFCSTITTDGPTISIKNSLKKIKEKQKILIFNSLTRPEKYYKNYSQGNLKIKTLQFRSLFNYLKLIYLFKSEINKHKEIEFHCIYDFLGCFLTLILLKFFNKQFKFKFYLRGMANKKILRKKKFLKLIYLFLMSKLINKKKSKLIATSFYEKNLAYQIFDRKFEIDIRPNLVDNKIILGTQKKIKKKRNHLKLFFMSNITWKKNFEFVFKILRELDFAITLNIYGSVYESPSRFEKYIQVLRNKHKVNFYGEYNHKDVKKIVDNNHLMFLPTYDENFGHSIVECLLSYKPCLISNNTPWSDINFFDAGYAIPLESNNTFVNVLREFYLMDNSEFQKVCLNARKYVTYKLDNRNF